MRLEETLSIYILRILQRIEIDGNYIAVLAAIREERRIMNLYGIENRNTIGKAIMVADSRTTGDWLYNHNLKYVTWAEVRGYMNVNLTTIHPYKGRYGKGFVRVVPSYYKGKLSTKFMTIQYWIEK